MDVEVPTSRGQIPTKDKKDSETEDTDTDLDTDIDDGSVHHASFSYSSSKVIWREVTQNTTPLTWLAFAAAVAIAVGVIVHRGLNLFFLHAMCMSIGYVAFATEAMLVFRPFPSWNVRSPNQRVQRNIHRFMNQAAGIFTILGLVAICVHRWSNGKSLIPHGIHSWMGSLVILLILVQIVIGHKKLNLLLFQGQRSFRFHGKLGRLTYALSILTVILGIFHIYKNYMAYVWTAVVALPVIPVIYAYTCTTKHVGYAAVDQL
ncbi:unnamed protein product [Aphanomyces euteiches]|uniref:Cytochrome b561 domain-containing protein n=1 Tax=Aphanomyces euteiches TaxID=100861 RepID=A0A6G0WDI2_9STRA|nr:hypothetical protein Ae201684_016924 [Aphanomyces euteiches]KAH9076782.1 hypothetical protein Ae201684P_010714 [Aphanomyces euteiches]